MKKIVIVGCSYLAGKLAEEIREKNIDNQITIVSVDGIYPNNKERWTAFLSKEINVGNVLNRPKDFYQKNNIQVVFEKTVSRINLKRKKVFFDDKESIDFDDLVIVDVPELRMPDIRGIGKVGVFSLNYFRDFNKFNNNLLMYDSIAIRSDSCFGLQLALAISKRGKEVSLIRPGEQRLDQIFGSAMSAQINDQLTTKGIHLIEGNDIVEILGDADAKAIRLKSGKVLASDSVLFEDIAPDLRVFSDMEWSSLSRIPVNEINKTEIDYVYALGSISTVGYNKWIGWNTSGLDALATSVASALNGIESTVQEKSSKIEIQLLDNKYLFDGQTGILIDNPMRSETTNV